MRSGGPNTNAPGSLYTFPELNGRALSPILCDQCARLVDGKEVSGSIGRVMPGAIVYLVEPGRLDRNVPCGCYADAVWLASWRKD